MSIHEVERRLRAEDAGERDLDLAALSDRLHRVAESTSGRGGSSRVWRFLDAAALTAALVAFAVIVLPRLPATPQPGASVPADIVERGQLLVAVSNMSPQVRSGGLIQGFDVDVVTELGRLLGLAAHVDAVDPARIAEGGWSDRWDLAIGANPSPFGETPGVIRLEPYAFRSGAIVVRSDRAGVSIIDALSGPVCVVAGSLAAAWATADLGVGGTPAPVVGALLTLPSLDACLASLRAGGVAAVLVDFRYDVANRGTDLTVLPQIPFVAESVPLIDTTRTDATQLAAAVANAIQRMRDDGTLGDLSRRRFGGLDITGSP